MICLRCGHCCTHLCVVIVNDPTKVSVVDGPTEDDLIEHDGLSGPCKHLLGDKPGSYSCALHDYPWYKDTPCYTHSQIGSPCSPCRQGVYIMAREAAEQYREANRFSKQFGKND